MQHKPILAVTMGDVNGVGPEILAKALARPDVRQCCQPLVYGSAAVLQHATELVDAHMACEAICSPSGRPMAATSIQCVEAGWPAPPVQPGQADPRAGACAIEWVKAAVADTQRGFVDGVVTCPISKAVVYRAGYHWIGHTELVSELCGAKRHRMSLFAGNMRVVHHTGHVSLRDALDAISVDSLCETIQVADSALRRMGFAAPRVAVMGLNPHAGEEGAFGREEIEIVAPAVAACQAAGVQCSGPYPPDTLLGRMRDGAFDVVVALYHDQGHIPMKLVAMDEGVNVTLGIPIVRTSPDHGTAFDIAWRGIAREDSLCAAIGLAARLSGFADK